MHLASIESISKSYGDHILFKDITFHISQGDKIALIAKNGQGKTSLLNILTKLDQPDSGSVWVHKDIHLVYLKQENAFNPTKTIAEEIFRIQHPAVELLNQYETLLLEGNTESQEFQQLVGDMNDANAWSLESEYQEITGKLNLPNLNSKIEILSGGQKKRLALAQALLETKLYHGKTLFVLDEPTNHLDVDMIEWLEQQLSTQNSTLLLVSHDRYFIDHVCNTIIELDEHKAYKHHGNYQKYLENKALRLEAEQTELAKTKNHYKKELEWMRRQPQARATKSNARKDAFYQTEKVVKQKRETSNLQLNVKMSRLGGKVLEMKKLYKSYDDLVILKGFDYTFQRGERIGIVGKNGVGKSTLLRIALGLEQADSGKINHGETVVFGHFDQKGLQWKEDKRVLAFVKEKAEYFPLANGAKISAAQFLERFAFPAKKQHTFLSKLSGGEKRRLQLLSILFTNPNFLVLDEPTNDLDLETLQLLEEFLIGFPGCLILVSHDRYFMDKLVQHLFVFKGNGEIQIFPGNYTDYRIQEAQKKETKTETKSDFGQKTKPKQKSQKLSYNEKREFEQIEKELPKLEEEKTALTEQLNHTTDYAEIEKISIRLGEINDELEEKEMRWLELSERV